MSKKIAVIVAGMNETYQSSILHGIQSVISDYDFDVYVFTSFTGMLDNISNDYGELNIFNLPDFNDFDGAILLTNTVDSQLMSDDILVRIKKAGKPAVSIDNDIEGMFHVGIDNKSAMKEITEHFINVHGFTKFNYISGPDYNSESKERLEGFLEALAEHNIPIEKERIFYGDFRSSSGKTAVEYFLRNNEYMPQAMICANDIMAATAINRLFEAGYKIPEEITVSGFDNIFNNHNLRVELTSVKRPLALSGQIAVKMLYNHFSCIPQERSIILNMSTHFTESCGCDDGVVYDNNYYRELNIANCSRIETITSYMWEFNKLSCELHGCSTFEKYIECLKKFVAHIDPEEFYFCLCDNWRAEFIDSNGVINKKDVVYTEYTKNIFVPIAYFRGKFYDVGTISRKSLIPDFAEKKSGGGFYYFLPLHFNERCLGYMSIKNCKISLHNSMFQSWCITINNSLENIRKLICLNYAVNRLESLYTQDTFSGIYNRNGFVKATGGIFRECAEQHRNIMLMFIDLDGLKVINDTYGHETGDIAIRSIAEVLCESCTESEIFCRFGGDEFIVFAPDYTEKDADNLTQKIEDNIAEKNSTSCYEFMLSASTGYIITIPEQNEDLFRFVTEADKAMYETKRKKKLSNYLKS